MRNSITNFNHIVEPLLQLVHFKRLDEIATSSPSSLLSDNGLEFEAKQLASYTALQEILATRPPYLETPSTKQ
jgi:hypothetical protein